MLLNTLLKSKAVSEAKEKIESIISHRTKYSVMVNKDTIEGINLLIDKVLNLQSKIVYDSFKFVLFRPGIEPKDYFEKGKEKAKEYSRIAQDELETSIVTKFEESDNRNITYHEKHEICVIITLLLIEQLNQLMENYEEIIFESLPRIPKISNEN